MNVMRFTKMHGAANDFVVIDHREPFLPDPPNALVRRLCDRRRGVGADGVLLLERPHDAAGADVAMRYFNADGGPADYCGNGARCLARFALDLGLGQGGVVRLETAVGVQPARRSDEGIRIRFGRVEAPGPVIGLEAAGVGFSGRFVRAGVPHFVVDVEQIDAVMVAPWGGALRRHPHFGREGANVDFVQRLGSGSVAMRTYERGVEGETLACGSGAIASALWAAAGGAGSPVHVRTAGGDTLVVGFEQTDAGYDVTLAGPAEVAFRGEWRDAGDGIAAVPGGS